MPKKKEKTELQLLNEINDKFDLLIAAVSSQNKEKTTQARLLRKKFKPTEIATILGSTPNAVRVMLHRSRQKNKTNGG
jgi:DNA-directed RNA polymerase specialized sigma24 family protein